MAETQSIAAGAAPTRLVRAALPAAYVGAWAFLGLAGAGYIGTLVLRPDLLLAGERTGEARSEQDKSAQRWLAPSMMSVAGMQRSLDSLAADVTVLKSTTEALDQREKAVSERVAVVETRISGIAAAAPPVPVASQTATAVPSETRQQMRIIATETTAVQVKRGRETAKVELPGAAVAAATPLETGSLQAPRRTPGVHLATGPSLDALRLSWQLLSDKHKAALKSLEPRYSGSESTSFTLVAGPLTSEADAQKLCAALKTRGVACKPAEFAGDGL